MKTIFTLLALILLSVGCSNNQSYPNIELSTYEGDSIQLDQNTALTLIYIFSMSNPVSIGELYQLREKIPDPNIDILAIAIQVDRPPNVAYIQQKLLIPIIIDNEMNVIASLGEINLTPALFLIKKGHVLHQQDGALNYKELNSLIDKHQ